jgi:hypothetical protein
MTLMSTLLTDGSSDVVLLPILRWLFSKLSTAPVEVRWADLRGLRKPPSDLRERIERAVELYPCQLLLVHRDAEKQPATDRFDEIEVANHTGLPHVCVVPVRMQEAWLLHDETALRRAAGRPSGREPLGLPSSKSWEALPDPKDVLHRALIVASGAKGRKAKQFKPQVAAHRLADLIEDWSPLRGLSAFQQLEADMLNVLVKLGCA